jgi:cell division protein FtsN
MATLGSGTKMVSKKAVLVMYCAVALGLFGCSRQQSDWEKARADNTTDSYEQFLKKYPAGEFTVQAQARVKELYEERDWQKARDADTPEAYQAFLKQYPEGKWTEEARIRVENFTLAQAPPGSSAAPPVPAAPAGQAMPSTPGAAGAAGPAPAATTGAAPTAGTASKSARNAGAYGIQLGAFKTSAEAANKRWARLQKAYPAILAGLTPTIAPKQSATGTVYRLQAMNLSKKDARAICKQLTAKSQPCIVLPAAHPRHQ